MRKGLISMLILISFAILIKQNNCATVLASCFSDKIGNKDNNLFNGGYYYAELGCCGSGYYGQLGKLFGYPQGLPNGFPLKISYNGRTIQATKGDIGSGGPSKPLMDIHIVALGALYGKTGQATNIQCLNFLYQVQVSGITRTGEEIMFVI